MFGNPFDDADLEKLLNEMGRRVAEADVDGRLEKRRELGQFLYDAINDAAKEITGTDDPIAMFKESGYSGFMEAISATATHLLMIAGHTMFNDPNYEENYNRVMFFLGRIEGQFDLFSKFKEKADEIGYDLNIPTPLPFEDDHNFDDFDNMAGA